MSKSCSATIVSWDCRNFCKCFATRHEGAGVGAGKCGLSSIMQPMNVIVLPTIVSFPQSTLLIFTSSLGSDLGSLTRENE